MSELTSTWPPTEGFLATQEQREAFLRELAGNLAEHAIKRLRSVESAATAEGWNGHELRALLAETACSATCLVRVDAAVKGRRFARTRAYLGLCAQMKGF